MRPAAWPREVPGAERLLCIDPRAGTIADAHLADFPSRLRAGDLVVVNDAATLPSSLHGRLDGAPLEVRLQGALADGSWRAVTFGAGDWHTPTEHRPLPPALRIGSALAFGDELHATIEAIEGPRLVRLRFDRAEAALFGALYRLGRPVQYAYTRAPLELWHTQTSYAARPWAMEQPSAGRPLTFELLLALRRRGVAIAWLTHAAGLSSTGDAALDESLPLPERYDLPAATVDAIANTSGRVIAVGTSVVRALEGAAVRGFLACGEGETDLRIRAGFELRVVDGLLTGMHEPAASHYDLLQAFAPRELLDEAWAQAEQLGYLCHEFGDSSLILSV